MKQIIIFIILLCTTGCYDYLELNDLNIIASVGLDYENNEYILTHEILNNAKSGDNGTMKPSYVVSSKGENIANAFDNLSLKTNKIPYYYHLKAVVISENIAKNHIKNIIDYIVRNPEIRNEFYLIIAKDISAKELISSSSEINLVIGDEITEMIKANNYEYKISYDKKFEDTLDSFLNDTQDAAINVFSLKNEELQLEGIALFNKLKFATILSQKSSAYFNLFIEEKVNVLAKTLYDDKPFIINIYSSKPKYKIVNNKIIINIDLKAEIKENNTKLDLKKEASYEKLNKDFSIHLTNELNNFIKVLQDNDSDALGLGKKYYISKRQKYKDILNIIKIEVKANVEINKKGLIFEVEYE